MSNNIEETINNFKGFMEGITGAKLNAISDKSKGIEVKEIIFEEPIKPIELLENDNTDLTYFSEKVIKQIVREDDENAKQKVIEILKEN